MSPFELVLSRLEVSTRNGSAATARCPAHDDRSPSLSVTEGDAGKVVVHCHAGCSVDDITAAIGLAVKDLFPRKPASTNDRRIVATYCYTDESGELLYQVVRFDPKDFRQRRPDGNGGWIWNPNGTCRVLYRLPELIQSSMSGASVFVVEGEKDADALASAGYTATCSPQGPANGGRLQPTLAKCWRVSTCSSSPTAISRARHMPATWPALSSTSRRA